MEGVVGDSKASITRAARDDSSGWRGPATPVQGEVAVPPASVPQCCPLHQHRRNHLLLLSAVPGVISLLPLCNGVEQQLLNAKWA